MERMISAGGRLEVLSESHLCQRLREAGVEDDVPAAALRGSDVSQYTGRGRPSLLRLPDTPTIVVKSLRHGGVLAFLWRDWFLGANRLLSAVELLQLLERSGVATPRVAFARIRRVGWLPILCRLELATYEVPDSIDLRAFLESGPGARTRHQVGTQVGRVLRGLHDCGVRHADLNVKNLLVVPGDDPSVQILDLEGSRRQLPPLPDQAVVATFERLLRSLVKTGLWRARVGPTWAARVLRSYDPDRWKSLWQETWRRYRRTARCHQIAWWLEGRRA